MDGITMETTSQATTIQAYSVELDIRAIRACLLVAAKDDIRYYLNGVFYDSRGYLVGCDGHRLLRVQVAATPGAPNVIIGRDTLAVLAAAYKGVPKGEIAVQLHWFGDIDSGASFILPTGARVPFKAVDGRYPDIDRVMVKRDRETTGKAIQINAEYAYSMHKVGVELNGGKAYGKGMVAVLRHYPEQMAVLVEFPAHPEAVGIIMECKE